MTSGKTLGSLKGTEKKQVEAKAPAKAEPPADDNPMVPKTIAQHEEYIKGIPDSANGSAAREAYMKANGLIYRNGALEYEAPNPLTEWDMKGYPVLPGVKAEDWQSMSRIDQRLRWWMLMSGGSMSDMSTEQDLADFINNGGRHKDATPDTHITMIETPVPSDLVAQITDIFKKNPKLTDKVLKVVQEHASMLRLPHKFSVRGSPARIKEVLRHKRDSLQQTFGEKSPMDLVLGAYVHATMQVSLLSPAPNERLHLLLSIAPNNLSINIGIEAVTLPAGMESVEDWEKSEEKTLNVQTDGGIGNLALKHGIKLNVQKPKDS